MIVRPVRNTDLSALIELARSAGAGLTSLPASEERMAQRVRWAELSFRGEAERADADYLFVLESDDGEVVGISAMTGAVGLRGGRRRWHGGIVSRARPIPDTDSPAGRADPATTPVEDDL